MTSLTPVSSEIRPLGVVLSLLRWKRTIAMGLLGGAIVGLAVAFLIERQYKSVARVLPPKETNLLGGLTGLSSLVRSLPSNLARLGAPEDKYDYMAILRSRTVMEAVVREFDLIAVYKVADSSMERAVQALKDNTEIDWTEENTLEIRVWDRDAARAAAIANYHVEILNRRSYQLQTQEARNTRQFIEQRLRQNRSDLHDAEQRLKAYQEKVGLIVSFDTQGGGEMGAVAELYGMKVKREIELGILRSTVGEENPAYQQAKLELKAMEDRLKNLPDIGIASLRLMRDVVIQQKIMEIVIPLHEQAKVNEHRDVPVAYLLDAAVPGERPDRPKRLFILGVFLFLGLVGAGAMMWFRTVSHHMRRDLPQEWSELRDAVRKWGPT